MPYKWLFLILILIGCQDNSEEEMKLFISSLSNESAPTEKVKVFLLTGQSNANGAAENSDALPSEIDETSVIQIFQEFQIRTGEFEDLNISAFNNYSQGNTYHGLELGLSDYLPADAYMIKYGKGSTDINQHLPGGSVYERYMEGFVTPGIAKLNELAIDYDLYLCFWQGEADAETQEDADAYSAKFDLWVSTWKGNLGDDIKIRVMEINTSARPYSATINSVFNTKALTEPNMKVIQCKDYGTELHFQYNNMKAISQLLINSL